MIEVGAGSVRNRAGAVAIEIEGAHTIAEDPRVMHNSLPMYDERAQNGGVS